MSEPRWQRLLTGYADLVKLCGVVLVLSLGVVTIPVALALAYDGVRVLRVDGALPPLLARTRALAGPASVTGGPALAATVGLTAIGVAAPSPLVTSAVLVLAALAAVVAVRAAVTVSGSLSPQTSRAWRAVGEDLLLHPAATTALVLPWIGLGYFLLITPVAVTVPVWCVCLSLPPLLGVLLTERRRTEHRISSTTERSVP